MLDSLFPFFFLILIDCLFDDKFEILMQARYVVIDRKGEGKIFLLAGSERRRASRAQDTGKPVIEQSTRSRRLLA